MAVFKIQSFKIIHWSSEIEMNLCQQSECDWFPKCWKTIRVKWIWNGNWLKMKAHEDASQYQTKILFHPFHNTAALGWIVNWFEDYYFFFWNIFIPTGIEFLCDRCEGSVSTPKNIHNNSMCQKPKKCVTHWFCIISLDYFMD